MSCQDSKINPWRSIVDSVEHYKIFIIIRDYENGYIDKNEANRLLNQRDLIGLENFVPEIKIIINDILKNDSKTLKNKTKNNVNSNISDETTL